MTESEPVEKPRVLLVTPYYGQVSMGLFQTLNLANIDRSRVDVVGHIQSSTSVLPACFNNLLALALDHRDEGRATHMAMCHSDILAEPGWINKLYNEMWFRNLDLISAVVPIKGPTGRTSTAIGNENDRWHIKRCIFDRDREKLPQTFTAANACGPEEVLLVNTGLFLCDLRRPYWDDFSFQFHTKIFKNPQTGKRETASRSEDWEMSYHLHENKAPYAATWAVKLHHEGIYKYPNFIEEPVIS